MAREEIIGPEPYDSISPEQEAQIEAMIEQDELDIKQMHAECRRGPSKGSIPVKVRTAARPTDEKGAA